MKSTVIYIIVLGLLGITGGVILHILHNVFFDIYLNPQSNLSFDILVGTMTTLITYTVYLFTRFLSDFLQDSTLFLQGLFCLITTVVLIILLALSTFGFNVKGIIYSFLSLSIINFFIPYFDFYLRKKLVSN